MNRIGLDQVAKAVGGRIVGPSQADHQVISGIATDSRSAKPGELFVALAGERFDGHDYVEQALSSGAAAALVSKPPTGGRPMTFILVRDTLAALGRLAAWYRQRLATTVVAVTGSNGKTTTKSMIAHILGKDRKVVASPKSFNNSIGVPLTLLSAGSGDDVIVCEVGSNAPGEVESLGRIAQPDVAVIVSVSKTHLQRLRSLEGVAAEKASLLGTVSSGGLGIICDQPPQLVAAAKAYPCKQIAFGPDPASPMMLGEVEMTASGISFVVNRTDRVRLPLLGVHNAMNALAAITVARRLGLSVRESADRLADFRPPPMRLEPVSAGGVRFINDAYNANPASMAAALAVFSELPAGEGEKVFVCGDMFELGDESEAFHHQLGQRIASSGVHRLIAVGRFAGEVVRGACEAGMAAAQTTRLPDTRTLVDCADELVRPGDLVLLKGSRAMGLERLVAAFETKQRVES